MRRCGFILVIDSYLVRKGLVSVLQQIPGITILQEFSQTHALPGYLLKQAVDFIIISQGLFDSSVDLFVHDPQLLDKIILLKDGSGGEGTAGDQAHQGYASILLEEDKEKIVAKILGLLDERDFRIHAPDAVELSPRETTIVRLVSLGLTNRQIADQLFLSTHTVMTHRKNISSKLGIKSVSGLTVYAIVNNIITIEEVTSKPSH
jgi:DNA-binding NarL/FixJ family response regulator